MVVAEKTFLTTVVSGTEAKSNKDSLSKNLKEHNHEESDILIIFHCVDISQKFPESHLDVFSPDTDVFLLLVHWYPSFCKITRCLTGKGTSERIIDIKVMFNAIGVDKPKAFMGFHVFTGSDTTGRFAGKSKDNCYKTFNSANANVLHAVANLGTKEGLPSLEITEPLEEFVCRIYSPQTTHKKSSDLRWNMFSQKHSEGERLPPTHGSLQHTKWL